MIGMAPATPTEQKTTEELNEKELAAVRSSLGPGVTRDGVQQAINSLYLIKRRMDYLEEGED